MHTYSSNVNSYQQTEIKTANRLEVLVKLYDGAVRFMNQAAQCQQKKDIAGKGTYISKSMAIINEFKNTLSFEHDRELATNLDRLYTFINDKLLKANITNEPDHIKEAIKITTILRDAWKELQTKENGTTSPEAKSSNQDNYFRISI